MRKRLGLLFRVTVLLVIASVVASPVLYAGDGDNGGYNYGAPDRAAEAEKTLLSRAELLRYIRQYAPGLNEQAPEIGQSSAPSAVGCQVRDPYGNPTTTVEAIQPGEAAYWFRYFSGGAVAQRVTFIAVPLSQTNPLAAQVNVFRPNSATNIETPVSIPYWGGDETSGQWVLIVVNDLNQFAHCLFNVIASTPAS